MEFLVYLWYRFLKILPKIYLCVQSAACAQLRQNACFDEDKGEGMLRYSHYMAQTMSYTKK